MTYVPYNIQFKTFQLILPNAQINKILKNYTPKKRIFKQFKISKRKNYIIIQISISKKIIKSFHPNNYYITK